MTTVAQIQIVAPAQLGNADASLYQSPSNTTTKVGRAAFCNTTAGAVTISAGITAGGVMGAAQTLISARSLAPGETYVSPELAGMVIPPGSQLHAFSSAAASVTFSASGLTIV
jgi:hypothetical protein